MKNTVQSLFSIFVICVVSLFTVVLADRGHSSVVEHSTADREVPGSIPGAPFVFFFQENFLKFLASYR